MRHSSLTTSNAPQLAYTLISDVTSLARSIELWTQDTVTDRRIAIDTEFIRERTYAPVLEMVQIASPNGHIGLIDVPAIKDLTALWQFLDELAASGATIESLITSEQKLGFKINTSENLDHYIQDYLINGSKVTFHSRNESDRPKAQIDFLKSAPKGGVLNMTHMSQNWNQ